MSIEKEDPIDWIDDLIRELPDDKFAPDLGDGQSADAIDLAATMKKALDAPIDYPPLVESVFAGDTVAVAIQSNLPSPKEAISGLLTELTRSNVALSDIVFVIHRNTAERLHIDASRIPQSGIADEGNEPEIFSFDFGFHTVNFQIHDSENQTGMAYIAANEFGDPVYVSRTMVDADVVLSIGFPQPGASDRNSDAIYPDFANTAIQERFESGRGSFLSRQTEVELANESLGSFFTIQIVSGPSTSIQEVYCGVRSQTIRIARDAANVLWRMPPPEPAEFVIATIESHSEEQNWDNFTDAVIAASNMIKGDGPILVWSDLGALPDRKIRKSLLSQFEDGINSKMTKAMKHLASIINERPVFLRSRLSRSVVEELGIGFVESTGEAIRISQPFSDGLLVRNAHQRQIQSRAQSSEQS